MNVLIVVNLINCEKFMYYFCFKTFLSMKRIISTLLFITVFLFLSCKQEKERVYKTSSGVVFGTSYMIKYQSDVNYQKSIDSLFYLVNKSTSNYMPTSDISKINKGDTTIVVDAIFKEVFQKSKRIYKETKGFLDPTVGNLVNAYGFGSAKEQKDLNEDELNELMQYVGFDKIKLKNNKIVKEHKSVYLDFNAIAKGFGIDVVGRFLESKSIKDYLIEIGGEIRARGVSSKNKPWKIGIDDPNIDGTRSISKYIELTNKSMAGSGNYRKFRIGKDGKKYVHTINPKTGLAKESNLLSAVVIADTDCADVDAYATAFMAMGFEKTKEFLSRHNKIKAYLVYVNDKGEVKNHDFN